MDTSTQLNQFSKNNQLNKNSTLLLVPLFVTNPTFLLSDLLVQQKF